MRKIIFEQEKCIGCGTCAMLCPNFWQMGEEGKAKLEEGEKNKETGNVERDVGSAGCNEEAAQSCPVECIHVE